MLLLSTKSSSCSLFPQETEMERFSAEERTFVVETFLKDPNPLRRSQRVRRLFVLQSNRPPPSNRQIKRLVDKLHNKQSFLDQHKGNSRRLKTIRTPGNIQQVEHSLNNDPEQSSRRNNVGMSKSSFNRISQRDLHFHPFRMVVRQELSQNDKANKLQLARRAQRELRNGTLDLQEILWSDGATFYLNEMVNTWNTRYYAEKGHRAPNLIQQQGQNQEKVHCWAALKDGERFGIFFSQQNITAQIYKTMISRRLLPAARAQGLNPSQDIILQYDRAPPHTTAIS